MIETTSGGRMSYSATPSFLAQLRKTDAPEATRQALE